MLVTDDAKYGSRRSEVALAAMSKQESTSVTSSTKPSVIKESFDKKGQSIKAARRRAYPIDAATCTASGVIDVDRRRREYPIDAATCTASGVIDVDRRRREYPIDAATCAAPVVIDVDRRRREYPIDAATCATPVVINAEEGMAGIRRELPLIDAAAMSISGKEGHGDARADSDDELTSVSDVPERTAEEDLLREVGLSDPS